MRQDGSNKRMPVVALWVIWGSVLLEPIPGHPCCYSFEDCEPTSLTSLLSNRKDKLNTANALYFKSTSGNRNVTCCM